MYFSDESMLGPTHNGRSHRTKYAHESWNNKKFIENQKAFPLEIHVWGMISA